MWYFETAGQTMDDPIAKTESNLRGETKFTDPQDVEALARIGQFVEDGILDPSSLEVDWDGMRAAFAQQESAIYYGGTWEIGWLEENVTDFEWGVFEFPQMPDVPGGPAHGGGPDNGMCIYSGIDDVELPYAVKFLEYISRPEVASVHLTPNQPIATSVKGVSGVDTDWGRYAPRRSFPKHCSLPRLDLAHRDQRCNSTSNSGCCRW